MNSVLLSFKIQLSLWRSHLTQHGPFKEWSVQKCVSAQEHSGISQQCHAPSKSKAVEKHLSQAQLVFLKRLSWLNPRTHLLQQLLGWPRVEWQQAQQSFMGCRRIGKLPLAGAGLPATRAQVGWRQRPEPMQIIANVVAEPLQGLALRTHRLLLAHKRRNQFHVRTQMSHNSDAPALATGAFGLGSQVAHVGHHLARPPRPTTITIMETGHKQSAFGNIARSHPTDQRHQQDRLRTFTPPQPEAVFFIADKPTALARLERPLSHRRVLGGISTRVFFLKPLQAAGRSVASMSAVAFSHRAACCIKGWRMASLICRSPITPKRQRKALSMRTSGTRWRCRKRAKTRHARCSGNIAESKLSECTGVSRASKCVRHSCAALNCHRGPRTGRAFQCSLMKSSGTYGSSRSSKRLLPVTGRCLMEIKATLCKTLCPALIHYYKFSTHQTFNQQFATKPVTPSISV